MAEKKAPAKKKTTKKAAPAWAIHTWDGDEKALEKFLGVDVAVNEGAFTLNGDAVYEGGAVAKSPAGDLFAVNA